MADGKFEIFCASCKGHVVSSRGLEYCPCCSSTWLAVRRYVEPAPVPVGRQYQGKALESQPGRRPGGGYSPVDGGSAANPPQGGTGVVGPAARCHPCPDPRDCPHDPLADARAVKWPLKSREEDYRGTIVRAVKWPPLDPEEEQGS